MDMLLNTGPRIGSPLLGIILPAVIFGISVLLTFLLVRYFRKN